MGAKWSAQRADDTMKDTNTTTGTITNNRKITMTKDGKPICFLCKRKFATMEKLQQHEMLSSLHKSNLAKKNKKELEPSKNKTNAEYRDRANERRSMYEADANVNVVAIDPSIAHMGPSLEKAREVTTKDHVTPDQTLGDANVGNQLLQKLGWKNGESLGRRVEEKDGNGNGDDSGLSSEKM